MVHVVPWDDAQKELLGYFDGIFRLYMLKNTFRVTDFSYKE